MLEKSCEFVREFLRQISTRKEASILAQFRESETLRKRITNYNKIRLVNYEDIQQLTYINNIMDTELFETDILYNTELSEQFEKYILNLEGRNFINVGEQVFEPLTTVTDNINNEVPFLIDLLNTLKKNISNLRAYCISGSFLTQFCIKKTGIIADDIDVFLIFDKLPEGSARGYGRSYRHNSSRNHLRDFIRRKIESYYDTKERDLGYLQRSIQTVYINRSHNISIKLDIPNIRYKKIDMVCILQNDTMAPTYNFLYDFDYSYTQALFNGSEIFVHPSFVLTYLTGVNISHQYINLDDFFIKRRAIKMFCIHNLALYSNVRDYNLLLSEDFIPENIRFMDAVFPNSNLEFNNTVIESMQLYALNIIRNFDVLGIDGDLISMSDISGIQFNNDTLTLSFTLFEVPINITLRQLIKTEVFTRTIILTVGNGESKELTYNVEDIRNNQSWTNTYQSSLFNRYIDQLSKAEALTQILLRKKIEIIKHYRSYHHLRESYSNAITFLSNNEEIIREVKESINVEVLLHPVLQVTSDLYIFQFKLSMHRMNIEVNLPIHKLLLQTFSSQFSGAQEFVCETTVDGCTYINMTNSPELFETFYECFSFIYNIPQLPYDEFITTRTLKRNTIEYFGITNL